jgi:hypothetical protein
MNLFEAAGMEIPEVPTPDVLESEFDAEELAWFESAPVSILAAWHFDMLEYDDQVGRRSRRTRQLKAVIRKRKISDDELAAALPPFVCS